MNVHRLIVREQERKMNKHFLYKYGSFEGEGIEYLKEVLLESKIYFSNPIHFNDPFDCRPRLEIGSSQEEKENAMEEVSSILSNKFPHAPKQKIRPEASTALFKLNNFYKSLGNQYELLLKDFGVYCLSEKKDNLLMWAHYGKAHTGYCLEFDASEGTFIGKAHEVRYQKEYPVVQMIPTDPDRGKKGLLTKSLDWDYEEEWRIITPEGRGHIDFPFHELVGIIFGCKIRDEHAGIVKKLIASRDYPVKIYRAVINSSYYKLDIIEL